MVSPRSRQSSRLRAENPLIATVQFSRATSDLLSGWGSLTLKASFSKFASFARDDMTDYGLSQVKAITGQNFDYFNMQHRIILGQSMMRFARGAGGGG
jgi:hypothetical protein